MTTKDRLISAINVVLPLDSYNSEDCIYSQKYDISATDIVYILQKLSKDFNFTISDDFVDAMEAITFADFENLLEKYENTNTSYN